MHNRIAKKIIKTYVEADPGVRRQENSRRPAPTSGLRPPRSRQSLSARLVLHPNTAARPKKSKLALATTRRLSPRRRAQPDRTRFGLDVRLAGFERVTAEREGIDPPFSHFSTGDKWDRPCRPSTIPTYPGDRSGPRRPVRPRWRASHRADRRFVRRGTRGGSRPVPRRQKVAKGLGALAEAGLARAHALAEADPVEIVDTLKVGGLTITGRVLGPLRRLAACACAGRIPRSPTGRGDLDCSTSW